MARILVLDGHSAAALSVTRSAGRAGHWVAVGANRGLFAAAKLSRFCRIGFDYPVSTSEPDAFVNSILEFVHSHSIDLLIPVTDWTLGPLSAQRARFAGVCRVAMPSESAIEFSSDKHRTVQLAESIGISVPRNVLLHSPQDLVPIRRPFVPRRCQRPLLGALGQRQSGVRLRDVRILARGIRTKNHRSRYAQPATS